MLHVCPAWLICIAAAPQGSGWVTEDGLLSGIQLFDKADPMPIQTPVTNTSE